VTQGEIAPRTNEIIVEIKEKVGSVKNVQIIILLVSFFLSPLGHPIRAASWQEEWDMARASARKEGRVVLGTSLGLPAFRQKLISAFVQKFGIELEFRIFGTAELVTVASRECAADRPSMDVLLSGNSEILTLYPKGCLAPVKSKLVLPDVVDGKNWRDGTLKFNDPERQYLLQTAEANYGWTVINTGQVKAELIPTAKDLLKPEYRGKIASFDPRRGGAGQGRATYILTALGEDYFRELYIGQKIAYTSDHRQLGEWLARGIYSVGLGAVERAFEPLRKEGLPVGVISAFDDAPGYLTGGSSVLKLVKESPHPNAGMVLLNWFASKEAQEIYVGTVLQPSRRSDVSMEGVPEYLIPKPGLKYFDSYDHEFYAKKRPAVIKRVIKLLGR
jgi:ABC-type Fe3+ transport system substrate-binding protein